MTFPVTGLTNANRKGMLVVETKKTGLPQTRKITFADDPHAPFIFFDGVPNSGAMEGVVTITLSAQAMLPNDGQTHVNVRHLAVAYLRCNRKAALALKKAIDNALFIGTRTEGGPNDPEHRSGRSV